MCFFFVTILCDVFFGGGAGSIYFCLVLSVKVIFLNEELIIEAVCETFRKALGDANQSRSFLVQVCLLHLCFSVESDHDFHCVFLFLEDYFYWLHSSSGIVIFESFGCLI
jgi:hypothetical protein